MATYYWVGGTGGWSNSIATNWRTTSGGTTVGGPPTSADTAVFDSNSGTGTVLIASTATCATLNFGGSGITAVFSGTNSAFASGSSINISAGSFSTSTYSWTATNGTITVTGGAFTSGGALTTGSITSSGSTTRTITVGNCTLSGSSPIQFSGTNETFTHTSGGTITCSAGNLTFTGNGHTFYNVTFSSTAIGTVTIVSANTFSNLTFSARASSGVSVINIGASSNQTINGTLSIASGNTAAYQRYQVVSSAIGTSKTLTAAAVSLTDVDFRDITGAGAATWSGTRLGDAGGNSGITFATASTWYWNAAAGNWGSNSWATTSTGTPAATNFPLPQDTALFTNNNPATSGTVAFGAVYFFPTIDCSARTNAMTLSMNVTSTLYGNVKLTTAVTLSQTSNITFNGRNASQYITSAGNTWGGGGITFNTIGGTVYLADAFSSSGTLTLTSGTFNTQGYNCTATTFNASSSTTLTLGASTLTLTGNGSAAFLFSGTTVNAGTSTISMTSASAKTFSGSGKTYYNLNQGGAGALTIVGANTFNNITNTVQPTTVTFTAPTTQTFTNFSLSGTAGNLVTINSTTAGTQAILSKTSGTVSCDYLSIQDSKAQGGASWYAGANSTNVSNNTGWIFTAPPSANSNFLMFF